MSRWVLTAGRAASEGASALSEITNILRTTSQKFKFGLSLRLGHKSFPFIDQLANV